MPNFYIWARSDGQCTLEVIPVPDQFDIWMFYYKLLYIDIWNNASPYAVHMELHLCPQTLMNLHIVSVCAYSLKHNAKEVGWLHICLKDTNFVKASIWALKACKKNPVMLKKKGKGFRWRRLKPAIIRKSLVLSRARLKPVFDQGWLKNLTIYPME